MPPLACAALSVLLIGSASARPRGQAREPAPVGPGAAAIQQTSAIHGRVVTAWGWGVGQRIVRIGGQRTFTDSEGRFTFEKVSTGRREPPDYLLDQVTFCAVRPADKL